METLKIESRESNDFPEDDDPFLTRTYDVENSQDWLEINKFEVKGDEEEEESDTDTCHENKRKITKARNSKKDNGTEDNLKSSRLRVRYPCKVCSRIFPHIRLLNDHLLTHCPGNVKKKGKKKRPRVKHKSDVTSQITLENQLNLCTIKSEVVKCDFGAELNSIKKPNCLENKFYKEENEEVVRPVKDNEDITHPVSSPVEKIKRNTIYKKKLYKCAECDKEFGNKIVYKKHLMIHQDLNKGSEGYKCRDCWREFYSENGLRVHIRNSNCKSQESSNLTDNSGNRSEEEIKNGQHSSRNCLKCPDCPREFPELLKLDIHLVSVHLKEPKCSQCGKIFPNGPRLFRHHNVHKLPSYKCPQEDCNAAFRTKEGLVVHQRKHEGILPHICPVCQRGFQTKPLCVLHRIEAHGQKLKPISCTYKPGSLKNRRDHNANSKTYPCMRSGCDFVFKFEQSLTIHLRRHDGLLPYVCPVCPEAFSMKQQCLQHRVEVHKENLSRFLPAQSCQCETCGATFKNPYTLKNHIKRDHSSQKNFECEICAKKFALEYDFKVHKGYHAGAKSFTCELCGKSFNSKGDLVRHSWSHKPDSEKPYQCKLCGKGFVRKVHYVEHGRLHTGEPKKKPTPSRTKPRSKPEEERACKFCDKTWTSQDALRAHLRRVHGRDIHGNLVGIPKPKLYICHLCPKVFHKRIRLVEHSRNIHGLEYQERRVLITPPENMKNLPPTQTPREPEPLPLPTRYPGLWGQLPSSNIFHPLMHVPISPIPPQPFQFQTLPFHNTRLLTDSLADAPILEPPAVEQPLPLQPLFVEPPPLIEEPLLPPPPLGEQPFYVQTPIVMNTVPSETHHSEYAQIDLDYNIEPIIPISMPIPMPVDLPEVVSVVVERNLLETQNTLLPDDAPKWESTYEPEVNLDDFFDDSSPAPTFDEIPKEDLPSSYKMDGYWNTIFTLQDKNPKLSEEEKVIVRKYIGSRCFSLQLDRLPIYCCKICSGEWHKKDLYEKHCRSIRHWEAVWKIKDTSRKIMESKETEDLDVKRKCSICGIRFNNLKILVQHCRSEHEGQKSFSCQLCGTAYFNYKHLRHHLATFHKEGEFVCVVCKEKCPTYELYRKHITTAHKDVDWKCPLCPTSFNTLTKLTGHCQTEHPGEKPFSCDICGTAYLRYKDYRNHRSRFHNEDDPNAIRKPGIGRRKGPRTECKVCGKKIGNMKIHMTLHSGEKNHLCDICGKSFRKKCNLVAHKSRHLGETRFPCTECGKQFYRRRDLRLHYVIHTKNYFCAFCPQKFATDTLLQKHSGLHDPNRPFRCEVCGFMFNHRGNLATHLKKLHPHFSQM